jgi:hypothetical protein
MIVCRCLWIIEIDVNCDNNWLEDLDIDVDCDNNWLEDLVTIMCLIDLHIINKHPTWLEIIFMFMGYTYKRDIESRLRGGYHNTFTIPAIINFFLKKCFF